MKNPQSTPPARRTAQRQPGFAILVTLSLMVLLIVIALGLLSLSSISLRTSSKGQAVAEAQANARMALMLAIGELQRELGSDQRVNAPASIITADDGKTTSAKPGRRHWLSSHDSWDSTSEIARPSTHFRKWLVSGADSLTADPSAPATEDSGDVILWSSIANDPNRVAVPKTPVHDKISNVQTGTYAWWIGDENSKALVSRLPQNLGDPTLTRADAQSAPASAYHRANALTGIDRNSENLGKFISHDTLDLILPNGTHPADKSFHDFTNASMGILTDVARGGLKRDISLYLDHPVSKPLAPMLPTRSPGRERLYPNGITWEELWLYQNVWRALEAPHPALASTTGGDISNTQILMTKPGVQAASISAFRSDPYSLYKVPVLLRHQIILSFWTRVRPPTSPPTETQYDLFAVTDCLVTIWNPFDAPIALHPESYMTFKFWVPDYLVTVRDTAGVILTTRALRTLTAHTTSNREIVNLVMGTGPPNRWTPTGTRDPVVLMPGEVLFMSQRSNPGDLPIIMTNQPAQPTIGMRAGWNLGAGIARQVFTSRPITTSSALEVTFAPNTDTGEFARVLHHYGPHTANSGGVSVPSVANYEQLGERAIYSNTRFNTLPSIFPVITTSLPRPDAMTNNGKHPVFILSHQTKSEDNPTAMSHGQVPVYTNQIISNATTPSFPGSAYEYVVNEVSGPIDSRLPQMSPIQNNRGLFGGSYSDIQVGVDTVIFQSIPREPPLTLGTFQHAIATGHIRRMSQGATALSPRMENSSQQQISHAISNSYALPVIPQAQTRSGTIIDHSYHVNRMLWDSWFLSSIVQRQSPHHTTKKTARQVYQDFLSDHSVNPLPNRRMKPAGDAIATGVDALFDATDAKTNAHELASSKLMVEGAFNVNSTSVEAWKAILGSMEGIQIPVAEDTNRPGSAEPHLAAETPVHGLLTAHGTGGSRNSAAFDGGDTLNPLTPAQWRGYRSLTPSEIEDLATALVEEIRNRGPFLSMADFINRRPDGTSDHALRGPLQAALDRTVNKTLFATSDRVGTADAAFVNGKAAELPKSMAAPLHVKQADILTSIGSQLTARSDTFRIRAYGESVDRNGMVLAKAWCEALVQRLPQYVDPIDAPEAADAPSPDPEPRTVPLLTSEANRTFGRHLTIQSFRWLSAIEIQS